MPWTSALTAAVLLTATALPATAMPAAAAGRGEENRSLVFSLRFTGLVAQATWTTCPEPQLGDVCTDTIVLAFDAATREGKAREDAPVVRALTFVYRVVGGEFGTVPVAEWFGRTEEAVVDGEPRLRGATAHAVVPVQVCTVFDESSGLACPDSQLVDLTWTGEGPLTRFDDHTVITDVYRIENTWTRGWDRAASVSGIVGDADLGVLFGAGLTQVDQGEVVVQHPLG